MADETKVTNEVTEAKEVSKTDKFKEHVQKIIFQVTGKKVSKSTAWELYKAIFHGSVEFVLNDPDKKVPLAGVCTLEVLETKPRGSKAGLDKDGNPIDGAEPWTCVPRFRVYPSSVVDNYVEYKYGLGDHEGIVEKHYGVFKTEEEVAAPAKEEKKADAVSEALSGLDEI